MKLINGFLAALIILLSAPLGAAAQAPDTIVGNKTGPRRWFALRLDYANRQLGDKDISLTRNDASVGATVYALPWLGFYAGTHFGVTESSFKYELSENYLMDGGLKNVDVSLEAGTNIGIVAWGPLTLDVFASFEFTPYEPQMDIASAGITNPKYGRFDCQELCSQHLGFRYNVNQLRAGLVVHGRIWRFVPRLGLEYQRLGGKFDPIMDEEAQRIIGALGFDPKKVSDDLSGTAHLPVISPGLIVELPYGLGLNAELSFVPVKTSNFMTIRAGIFWSY